MSHPKSADIEGLLRALSDAKVRFIVVGGAAGVLHGAPITTQDLDIVHDTSAANVDRLAKVLDDLDAVIRDPGRRGLRPSRELLAGTGQMNLSTRLGPLDPLCRLHDGRGYDELLPSSELATDGELEIRLLELSTLIEVKSSTGRARDKLVVPILLALLREREAGS